MNVAILKRQSHHSLALTAFHYQISRKVLNEVVRVVFQRLTETCSITHCILVVCFLP